MPVDTTIQYNGYNSFKLLENEVISCSVFGVEGMAFITTSFQSYCPSAIATGVRMYVRFFDASNAIISTSNHSFALTASAWVKQAQTLSVPATAKKAQIFFTNPVATAWYMAQPKCEEGEVASSFTINLSAQLTHIAPDGIYTGTLTANQIIVSSTDTLDTALTAISNGQIILMSNYNSIAPKVTKITADGVYTGLVVANQISTGTLNGSLVNVINMNASNIVAGTLSADRLAAGSITADKINVANLSAQKLTAGDFRQYFVASAGDWASLDGYDLDYSSTSPAWTMFGSGIQKWISISAGGQTLISIKDSQTRIGSGNFQMHHDTSSNDWSIGRVGDVAGYFRVGAGLYDANAIEMMRGNGLYALGVDSNGAYYRKNSPTKIYF